MTATPLTFLEGTAADACVLALEVENLLKEIETALPEARLLTLKFSQLSKALLTEIAPDLVIAPLFNSRFDALQLGGVLGEFGYAGRLYVTSTPLPNRAMVETELRSVYAQTQLCIVTTQSDDAPLKAP